MCYDGKCARWHARRPSAPPPGRQDGKLPCGAGRLRVRMDSIRVVPVLLGTPALAPPPGRDRCARAAEITARQPSIACASTDTPYMCDRACRYQPVVCVCARTYVYVRIICTHGPPELDFQSILVLCLGRCLCPGLQAPRTTRALGAWGCAGPGGSCGKIVLKPRPPSLS